VAITSDLDGEAAELLVALVDALAEPADDGELDLGAGREVAVLPGDVVHGEAEAEDLGGDLAEGLDDGFDDGGEGGEDRDDLEELEKILGRSAHLIGRELIVEDGIAVPSELAADREGPRVDVDDAADLAEVADADALLPGALVGDLGDGEAGIIEPLDAVDDLGEGAGSEKGDNSNKKSLVHCLQK